MNQYTPRTDTQFARLHRPKLVSRRIASNNWKASRRIVRKAHHEHSMMHMGAPAGHRVIGVRDEHTQRLMAAHMKRLETGWIRG